MCLVSPQKTPTMLDVFCDWRRNKITGSNHWFSALFSKYGSKAELSWWNDHVEAAWSSFGDEIQTFDIHNITRRGF